MNIFVRAIIAIIMAVLCVFILNAAIAAFASSMFTPAIVRLLDLLIVAAAICWLFFGERWFIRRP